MRWFWKKKQLTHYEKLAKKWVEKQKKSQEKLWYHHGGILHDYVNGSKRLAVGSLAGLMLLASPGSPIHATAAATVKDRPFKEFDRESGLLLDLAPVLPQTVRPLTSDEEQKIGGILTNYFGFPVSAELDGKRLNRSYGYIGQEQHLYRYPGDNIYEHFADEVSYDEFQSYGIAPGLGAYGYFARSRDSMTAEDAAREKWYIAVQTFLAPGYNDNVREMNTFFAYRKMLVVNAENGRAVVADIADAGPSPWTGKQLGGSPEVMRYLQRFDGAQKGPVLYFFIDDPDNKIPLGPMQY